MRTAMFIYPIAIALATTSLAQGKWKKQAEEGGVKIYSRAKSGTDIREIKAVGIVNSPPHACMNVVDDCGNFENFMPYTKESKIVSRQSATVVYSYQFLSLPIISDRDYTLRIVDDTPAAAAGGEPAYYKQSWTQANSKGPKARGGVVRVKVNTGHWLFEPLEGGKKTRATYYLFTDPGGMIPSFVANKANSDAIPDLFAAVKKQSKLPRYGKKRSFPTTPAAPPQSAPAAASGDTKPGG